jgi:hypothetical protein
MVEPLSSVPACYPDVAQTSQAPAYVVCAVFPTAWFVHQVRLHAYAMNSQAQHKMGHTAESSMSQLIVLEAIFGSIVLLLVGLVRAVDQ